MRAISHRLAWLALILFSVLHAEPEVPSALEPWRAWVLHGQEFRACPLIAGRNGSAAGDYLCAWPGVLQLSVDDRGAYLVQRWNVEAESWIPLPGDESTWPQQVTVDGQPAPLVRHDGPAVRLAAGHHEIRARLPWDERPQSLLLPPLVGSIALTIDGHAVATPRREGEYLTLGRGAAVEPEADSIDLQVFRKLTDGIPATLTTEIRLVVSGQAREETIGPALPAGFEPLTLDTSDWPARLDQDGRLHVQVQPGGATLTLTARAIAPLAKVTARVPAAPWPKQEIWSYESMPQLRVTTATSALQVDPRQAGVDEAWQALPAFALGDGAGITIEERSRGLAADDKNRLTLDREMWLDFSRDGWFARDRVGGEMLRGWRFDVAPPFALERADSMIPNFRTRGGVENLLVTRGTQDGATGVEWRTPKVDLAAGVRIGSAASVLPVTGWQDSFDRVTTVLHLPNGYRLLGAPGADSAAGSWLSMWNLLDVFIAAIVALLAWRLFGPFGAAIAVGYLVLGFQEDGAPLWTLLAAIALGLIARALPPGRLATSAMWLRRGALILLVLAALPFVAEQLRYALHPQLESAGTFALGGLGGASGQLALREAAVKKAANEPVEQTETGVAPPAEAPPPPPASPAPLSRDEAKQNDKLETTVTASNVRRTDIIDHYNASTVVQTGAGEPGWNLGQRYVLTWNGPVLPAQNVRLVIAPPWLVRLLRVVLVALLVALIARLALGSHGVWPRGASALGLVVALAAISSGSPAQAQAFPPDNLLNELRTHLTEAPPCAPGCAAVAKAEVSAHGDEIRVAIEAHAAARIALPIPGDSRALSLRSVTIDGLAQDGVAREKGELDVGVARGVHRIEIVYAAGADKIALRFPWPPMRIEFSGDGWQASGINDHRLLTETLSLARARENAGTTSSIAAQQFAPYVEVEREIVLGLDWSISTTVRRLAPKEGGFTASIPLMTGEHVSSAGIKTEGGQVIAAIADTEVATAWSSSLDKSDTLKLMAPALTDRAEIWRVTASPIWHLESSGVPVSADPSVDQTDYRRFEFHPLPGETLTLRVDRPKAAEGSTRAIDRARLALSAGQRAADAVLDLSMRTSQGGEQSIALPADAEVTNVTRNGQVLNLRPIDGKLSLPLIPGSQQFQIRFREPEPTGFITRMPSVALGLPAANIDLSIQLPDDRWLLATGGPAEGPAVLYWSELAVVLLVAWALARTRRTSLRLWQWILLGIGFSTFSWLALLVVVAWLFAIEWRARAVSPSSPAVFNLAQIGLALLTLVALLCVVAAIPQGLLGWPDMHVVGSGSSANALHWFADRSTDALPGASAISVPLWVYKVAMLAWALWLAAALVGWLRAGFAAWTRGGYWRALPRKPAVDIPVAPPPPPTARA
ncbi:MAG TPA: hypothetical protein VH375_04010 [Rhodanobacteraceae bacterium]